MGAPDIEEQDESPFVTGPLAFDESAARARPYVVPPEIAAILRESADPKLTRLVDQDVERAREAAIELLREEFGRRQPP